MADGEGLRYGARVFRIEDGVVLVKQTVQREPGGAYVIDEHRERHIDNDAVEEIGRTVLDALAGRLSKGADTTR